MGNNFEFDKIIIAIAIGVFSLVFSSNIGNLLYIPHYYVEHPGYKIDVPDVGLSTAEAKPAGIPDDIDMAAIMAKADPVKGKTIFKKCAVCHVPDKGGANKVGPHLWGIVGAKTARLPDFSYSAAMHKKGEDGQIWSFDALYRYLYSPKSFVPGTKMAFAGIKNDEERADLIAYLRTLSDNPIPLPKEK